MDQLADTYNLILSYILESCDILGTCDPFDCYETLSDFDCLRCVNHIWQINVNKFLDCHFLLIKYKNSYVIKFPKKANFCFFKQPHTEQLYIRVSGQLPRERLPSETLSTLAIESSAKNMSCILL
jgi:hypothetical protein